MKMDTCITLSGSGILIAEVYIKLHKNVYNTAMVKKINTGKKIRKFLLKSNLILD